MMVKEVENPSQMQAVMQLRYTVLRQPWNKSMESATDDLEPQSINAFMADDDGNAIACARLHQNENKIAQIRFMAVHQSFQGKGLGKLVCTYLETKAKELGYVKIQLQARENAVEFYKKCGYTLKEKSYLLWDQIQHYLMEKDL